MTLTKREIEVLRWKAAGLTAAQTAECMFIVKKTVDFHLDNVYRKLGVNNGISAIAKARERGVLK